MNLTIRDWMVIVGSLLILAVIVDAWRRMRMDRRNRVRVKLVPSGSLGDGRQDDITLSRELPNGGARVKKRRSEDSRRDAVPGESVSAVVPDETAAKPPPSRKKRHAPKAFAAVDEEPLAGVRPDREEPVNFDWLEDLPTEAHPDAEGGSLPRGEETEVIVLHVAAFEEEGFDGKAILEILLACDLRFGDMDFFHRHEREAGRGPIQFSVANMLKPGVFDIDNMATMRTRGLVFFLTLPGPEDMGQAFDYMLETARTVARNLKGELLDESRSALTEQSVALMRQQIADLERRMLARPR